MKTHLMKLFLAAGVAMMVGCGGPGESEERVEATPVPEEGGALGAQEQAFTSVCGLNGCPSGQHVIYYMCSSSCAGSSCSTYKNATACEPNTGNSFSACGTTCPSPYVVIQQYSTSLCSKLTWYSGGGSPNAVNCELP
jgi:hypothetical protein